MTIGRTRLQNWVALPLRQATVDGPPFFVPTTYLVGICIWIWAGKYSATWNVSGYIPMRCVSRQEAGNIMMVPVISVASSKLQAIQDEK